MNCCGSVRASAAELRLWDAIDQHRLTPFLYYGIHDGLDLQQVPWKRGRGYDVEGLTNLFTANDAWARLVLRQLLERVDDPARMRVLGFCVSVAHARFMARVFHAAGVHAVAVWADSPADERRASLRDLAEHRVQAVFSVDLFNEGVDVPAVDTILFLRPTDSPTLFIQQLGRGLRRAHGKTACTVLDFVGRHRQEFSFYKRFQALLGGGRRDVEQQVRGGFPFLPAGCHMKLDPVASRIVLDNLEAAVPSRWPAKAAELRHVATDEGGDVGLAKFLESSGLELEDVYAGGHCWSDLRAMAGLPLAPEGPREKETRRSCSRMLHIDDPVRIEGYRARLGHPRAPNPATLPERERRLLRIWTRPGSVWAGDHSQAPCAIDGEYQRLLLVRDLASGEQLLSQPVASEGAVETCLHYQVLFTEHGAPLVFKQDNGSGFVAELTREVFARYGVLPLFSPPRMPSYNGSCEAGNGSIKLRTGRIAASAGRPCAWTSDDIEAARLEANSRPASRATCTRDELWRSRAPITLTEREALIASAEETEHQLLALALQAEPWLDKPTRATICPQGAGPRPGPTWLPGHTEGALSSAQTMPQTVENSVGSTGLAWPTQRWT